MRVLATAIAVLLAPALACADSLGSAARKQAQLRDKPRAAEVKVYGEADLAARSDAAADESPPRREALPTQLAGTDSPPAATAPARDDDQLRRDLEREEQTRRQKESYWRQAAAAARARLANAQHQYDYVCAGGTRLTGG